MFSLPTTCTPIPSALQDPPSALTITPTSPFSDKIAWTGKRMQKGGWFLLYDKALGTINIKVGWILLRFFIHVFSYVFHSFWTKKRLPAIQESHSKAPVMQVPDPKKLPKFPLQSPLQWPATEALCR